MKALRALMIVLALSVYAFAGEMHTGRTGEMDNGKSGEMHTDLAGEIHTDKAGDMPNEVTEMAFHLLHSMLPLF